MKKYLLILLLNLLYIFSYSQTPSTIYLEPTISAMQNYFGNANRIFVQQDTSDYVLCTVCTIDNISVYSGVNGRKWLRMPSGSNTIDSIGTQLPIYTKWVNGKQVLGILQSDGIISGGIVTWTGYHLVYVVTPCVYQIGGVVYNSPQTTITLPPADPTYARQDVFIVDTSGVASFLEGTPSPSPIAKQTSVNQLALTTGITLNAGDTIPSTLSLKVVYDEGVGSNGGEWNTSTQNTVTIDTLNTSNPYHGVKDLRVSSYKSGAFINFTSDSERTYSSGDVITLHIYTNSTLFSTFPNSLWLYLYDGASIATNPISLTSAYGFNGNNSNIYQTISVPLSAFSFENDGHYNKVSLFIRGNDTSGVNGFYVDYVTLQSGTPNVPSATNYSNKVDSTTTLKINDSTYVGKYWIKGISYQRGDTIKINSTDNASFHTFTNNSDSTRGYLNRPNGTVDSFEVWANGLVPGGIQSIQAGTNVTVNNTDPLNPIISATGGGSADRFGIEDNTGVQDRYIDMQNFGFGMDNPNYFYVNTKLSDDSTLGILQATSGASTEVTTGVGYRAIISNLFIASSTEMYVNQKESWNANSKQIFARPSAGGTFYIPLSVNGNYADSTGNITITIDSTVTLSSGTITVSDTRVKTGAKIFISVNTPSGTQGFLSAKTSDIIDGTSFIINSTSATENSTVNYEIINP